jgi:dolichol-phosphate mannosyltransferase
MSPSRQIDQAPGQTVYIIFPCYNEEEGLEKLLMRVKNVEKISGRDFRLVIVNDGSSDHTISVAKAYSDILNIHIIDFPKNQGVATVFNTAFAHVLSQAGDDDIIVTIDSDNTMNPYTMLNMFDAMTSADVVIASRFAAGGKMVGAGYRALLSHVASWLMCWRVAIPNVKDYSIFFRSYRPRILRTVFTAFEGRPIEGAGFSCMANLLIRIHRCIPDAVFREVPLTLRYDMKEGGSGIRMFKTIGGYLKIAFGQRERTKDTA